MDQRERFEDDEEALRAAIQGVLKHHHVVTVDKDATKRPHVGGSE